MATKNIIKIEFKLISHALYLSESDFLIKEVKTIPDFKKWFKTHYFKCEIIQAFRVFPNGLKIELKELKNFCTFEKFKNNKQWQ